MTQAEYAKLYRAARDSFQNITVREKRLLKKAYQEAAALAATAVRNAELSGFSQLTISSLNQLEKQLNAGFAIIGKATENSLPLMINQAYGRYVDIDAEYLGNAFEVAGAGSVLTETGYRNMAKAANLRLINASTRRLYADGYTFSERIWSKGRKVLTTKKIVDGVEVLRQRKLWIGMNGSYQDSIKQVINLGFAQGRDPFKIARDIEVYAATNKIGLMKRYGTLVRGTSAFAKRIPKNLDWRAVRLVRSELYASLQAASLEQVRINPASTGWVDWRLTPGAQHSCICPKLSEASPYRVENVPAYPHSNCLCSIIPKLVDQREFTSDLKAWLNDPGSRPDLEQWYQSMYVPANIGTAA
jgi:hypothetical protein